MKTKKFNRKEHKYMIDLDTYEHFMTDLQQDCYGLHPIRTQKIFY